MTPKTTIQRPSLLEHPDQVAVIRRLISAARKAGTRHLATTIPAAWGSPAYTEHVWGDGRHVVGLDRGQLLVMDTDGAELLRAAVDYPDRVVSLLTAIGVLDQTEQVTRLREAVQRMAIRYGEALQDYAYSLNVSDNVRGRHLRAARRRFIALQRLTRALAAGGAR